MSFITRFLSRASAPPEIPNATIIPLHIYDDTGPNRGIALEVAWRFDKPLDIEALTGSLWKLLERPGWRKLGARMRLNSKGKLEYHILDSYSPKQPPFNFSTTAHDNPISQHDLDDNFPRTRNVPQILKQRTVSIFPPEHRMTKLADWTLTDKAQLNLHVVRFTDATLVGLQFPHTLIDAIALKLLFNAWIAVLEDREQDIPDFAGYDEDLLAKLGEAHPETEFMLKDKRIRGLEFGRFIFNYIREIVLYPKEEPRLLVLSAKNFAKIKEAALKDIESLDHTLTILDKTTNSPFLSDGDILTAWVTRLMASCNPSLANTPSAPATIINVFGMRQLLSQTKPFLLDARNAYVANCAYRIDSPLRSQDLLSQPLGHVAARLRKDITLQTTRPQIEASARIARAANGAPLYGSGDMTLLTVTNWTKAKFFDIDFSAAVVSSTHTKADSSAAAGGGGQKEIICEQCRPSFMSAAATSTSPIVIRNCSNVMGRDGEGNWWVTLMLRSEFMDALDRAIEGMKNA